ncbi:protein phosphatase 2C domain-containing protein [Nannocystis pusilla]|uniref:protein phosphatase 2C domain-containing protein n=1 Tax=Nannocystis pusilla TaxID=889268 RepID=UPI003B824FC5
MTMFMPRTASVPGRSHRRHNEPCQDSAIAIEDDDFAIVAVSDGVGNPLNRIGRGERPRRSAQALPPSLLPMPPSGTCSAAAICRQSAASCKRL